MRHEDTRKNRLGIGWALLFFAACGGDASGTDAGRVSATPYVCTDGPLADQRHGATCLCCHSEFGVAGSIDPDGAPIAAVVVTDARGQVASMGPNDFGNFFRHFDMTPPLAARVVGVDGAELSMQSDAPSGDCNGCHAAGGAAPPIHGP